MRPNMAILERSEGVRLEQVWSSKTEVGRKSQTSGALHVPFCENYAS